MTDHKPTLQECAMRYGTGMGLLWTFKFMLFPLGLRIPFLLLVFFILTLGVPVLGYVFAKKFRERYCNNVISFGRAFLFTTFMYMFASIFVAIIHYVYFRFIDDGFIFATYQNIIDQLKATAESELIPMIEILQSNIDILSSLSSLEMTFNLVSNNISWGIIMAIPTALLVMRKEKKQ